MKISIENILLVSNAGIIFSRKRLGYSSMVTMHAFQPDYGQRSSKKEGPRTKEAMKPYLTFTWGEWSGFITYSLAFDAAQMWLLCVLISLCTAKWTSSVFKTLNSHCDSCSIFVRMHLAKNSLAAISVGLIWCSDCYLCRYKYSILWRNMWNRWLRYSPNVPSLTRTPVSRRLFCYNILHYTFYTCNTPFSQGRSTISWMIF